MLTMAQPRALSQEAQTDAAKLLQPCSPPTRIPITRHMAPLKPMWGEGGRRDPLESAFLQVLACIG